MEQIIGRVVATERNPTTSTRVQFWVDRSVVVRPFDIVRMRHLANRQGSTYSFSYAVITDLSYLTDGGGYLASYVSSDFGDVKANPRNERIGTTIAEAEVLFNSEGVEMPVRDGSEVTWADAEGIREALGLRGIRNPVPAGYFTMSNGAEIPVQFEGDFLIGPEGAHLNIAGISGLATKTSYAMFLMNALQQKKTDVSMIIFNVKGYDLLSIDTLDENLDERTKKDWRKCDLEPKPFDNVAYFHPYSSNENRFFTQSKAPRKIIEDQINRGVCFNYHYGVDDGRDKIPFLFSDIEDPQQTMDSCATAIKDDRVSSWEQLREAVAQRTYAGQKKNQEIVVGSWRKFYRLLQKRIRNDIFVERSTTKSEKRRQKRISDVLAYLKPGSVVVIDIEPLPDYLQCLVFGDVISSVLAAKLGEVEDTDPDGIGRVVIFADELNKYAPKVGSANRTLTNYVLDITERGRSLGVVLFGAEQFRTGVHDRVLGNCSTNVFGRTSAVEIQKAAEYKLLTKPQQSILTRLEQGTLMLQHAVFTAAVIKAQFPRPIYLQPKG